MSRWLRFLPVVLVALIVVAFVWRLANPPTETIQSHMIGKPVPAFDTTGILPGRPGVTSAGLADGKPRIVNFFASWCVPCIAEADVLLELQRRGAVIEGIAVRDRPQDVAAFLREHGDAYDRIGGDPASKVQLAFGSSGVPETFVIDGRGIVRRQHIGPVEPRDVPVLLKALEEAR